MVCCWLSWSSLRGEKELEEVMLFWFGGRCDELQRSKWFARGAGRDLVDSEVRLRFGRLVERVSRRPPTPRTPREAVAVVVVLDQLARHAWRGGEDYERKCREANLKAVGAYEESFVKGRWDPLVELSPAQHVFCLLAARHAGDWKAALEGAISRQQNDASQARVVERFRRATERRCPTTTTTTCPTTTILEVAAFSPTAEAVASARRCAAFAALEAWARQEVVLREKNQMIAVVSLSGGVDSMVTARALGELREELGARVACAHVNYGNRPEAGLEAAYLREWCAAQKLPLVVLEMPEWLRRDRVPREEYELEARNRRFELYRSVAPAGVPVLLGHHRGDVEENCVSNVLRGASVLELAGMRREEVQHGVRVSRPLLGVAKADIYETARVLGVPYFKDTTPKWSTRGRLRDEVMPLLRDVYGAGCGRNLEKIARDSDALRDLAERTVFGPFRNAAVVDTGKLGTRLRARGFEDRGSFFWHVATRDLAHGLGVGRLGEGAVDLFLTRVRRDRPGWLELKKGWTTYLDPRGVAFFFRPCRSFRFRFGGEPPPEMIRVGERRRIGEWVVATMEEGDSVDHFEPKTLDDLFASGRVEYVLRVPDDDDDDEETRLVVTTTLRKYPPLRSLEALAPGGRLKYLVPILAPAQAAAAAAARMYVPPKTARAVRVTARFEPETTNTNDC
ncbi:hypothetical protein CTAYLR_007073 [Chrysophaeum taylorii]|uniref:tRNA(Ile)-lysidine synthetase n=1 Tax=Chrysophaeum taylorii TaxID=2483200 RepID=A0AAD7XP46_9STRA|nr:hypothetical protein CTAYLR_007073 [Chrysophaeum taylorii]